MMERESDDDGATTLIVREYDHGDVPYAAPMAPRKRKRFYSIHAPQAIS